jgi:hypothetical protein
MAQFVEVRVQDWIARELHTLGVAGFMAAHPGYAQELLEQIKGGVVIPVEPGVRLRRTDQGPARWVYEIVAVGTDGKVCLRRAQGPWTHPDKPLGSLKFVDAAQLREDIRQGRAIPTR